MDLTFVVSPFGAVNYLTKYVTKPEDDCRQVFLQYAAELATSLEKTSQNNEQNVNTHRIWAKFLQTSAINAVCKRKIGIIESPVIICGLTVRICHPYTVNLFVPLKKNQ